MSGSFPSLRRMFSFPVMMASALAVLAVLTIRSRFNDPDLWWHLRTGQIIWTTGVIPRTDLLSFTTGQHPWVAHEWLAQLSMYAAWKLADESGLMLWFASATIALLLIQYALCSLSGNSKVAFLGALIGWFFATVGLAVRPQLLGYSLLGCELLILELGRRSDRRWFLALPVLFALWINVHGSFFLGLVILALVTSSAWVDGGWGWVESRAFDPSRRRTLSVAAVLSAGALFTNPVGWTMLAYPVWTFFDHRLPLDAVEEWRRLPFDDLRTYAFLASGGAILLIARLRRKKLYLDEVAILAVVAGMAILHQRLLFAWGLVAGPVLCRQLADAWEPYAAGRDRIVPNAVLIAASVGIAIAAFPTRPELLTQVAAGNPTQAVDFIRRNAVAGKIGGRMFNEYVYGGYLSWALPGQKVFIDGRADVYAWTGVFEDYGALVTLARNPAPVLDKYGIDFCLLSLASPLAHELRHTSGWQELYSDSQAMIFVRDPAR